VFFAGKFLFFSSDAKSFGIGCIVYIATIRTGKRVEEIANVGFFRERRSGVHWSCYVLLFTDFVNFGQSRLSGLSLGSFINYTR